MQDQNAAPAKKLEELKPAASRDLALIPDQKIDMFSARGFALAQRIAHAFSTADAVPACFRGQVLKKSKAGDTWVDNPSAFGNCLVAIETAQTVGMSITAVMQNSNIIEGKLSWSGQFKIGAVNASGRFTPLRFDMKNKGMMKASYKEKGAWNDQARRFDMTERTIELENLVCVAWALPFNVSFPPGVYTLDQARAAGLPVIEGPPVSMKLAVEEGWYSKTGSKWQTEMKHKMLPIRAGAYFSDLHASDIVMGMGRSSDELEDMSTIDVQQQPNGQYAAAATLDELRMPKENKHPHAETVEVRDNQPEDPAPADVVTEQAAAEPAQEAPNVAMSDEAEKIAVQLHGATTLNQLADASEQISDIESKAERTSLTMIYKKHMAEFQPKQEVAPAAAAGPVKRRSAKPAADVE